MKNTLFILAIVAFASCDKDNEQETPCISGSNKNANVFCTGEYTPVCGCDGKTYTNSCTAWAAGVTRWSDGECK